MVPAINLLQCADTFMHATFVAAITGQWNAPLLLPSPRRATSYDATVLIIISGTNCYSITQHLAMYMLVIIHIVYICLVTYLGCWSASVVRIYFITYFIITSHHDHYVIPVNCILVMQPLHLPTATMCLFIIS